MPFLFTQDTLLAEDLYQFAETTDADFDPESLEELSESLMSGPSYWTFHSLEALGPEARDASQEILQQLDNEQPTFPPSSVCDEVFLLLQNIGIEILPDLLELYKTSDSDKKWVLLDSLQKMETDAREFLPLLKEDYEKEKEDREKFLMTIAAADPTGEVALPLLLKAAQSDESENLRSSAVEMLALRESPHSTIYLQFPPFVGRWVKNNSEAQDIILSTVIGLLEDKEPIVRAAAVSTLSTYAEYDFRIIEHLLPLLKDREEFPVMISRDLIGSQSVSNTVVGVLSQFPNSSDEILPELLAWNNSSAAEWWLLPSGLEDIFATLIPRSKEPIKNLRALLGSHKPDHAFLTIARMGKSAQSALGQFGKLLRHPRNEVRAKALITLACMDDKWQTQAVDMLKDSFAQANEKEGAQNLPVDAIPPDVLWTNLLSFLNAIGPNAQFAAPVIRNTINLEQKEWGYDEFETAVHLLSRSAEPTDQLLHQILQHPQISSLYSMTMIEEPIISMGKRNPEFFHKLLNDPETPPEIQILSLRVVGRHSRKDLESLPLIQTHLESKHPAVREAAIESLRQMQIEKTKVTEMLAQVLRDPRVSIRVKALEVLSEWGEQAKPSMAAITDLLCDDYVTVQIAAIRCLGKLERTASSAINDLTQLTKSDVFLIREEAKLAIENIQGDR